jgi:hypothetical protein
VSITNSNLNRYTRPSRTSAPAKRSRPNPISAKQSRKLAARARLQRRIEAKRGKVCQLRISPMCRGVSEHLHHRLKAAQGGPDTEENCLLACDTCNSFVETMDRDEQIRRGFTIERRAGS